MKVVYWKKEAKYQSSKIASGYNDGGMSFICAFGHSSTLTETTLVHFLSSDSDVRERVQQSNLQIKSTFNNFPM